jgi:hypothetical protein
MTKSELEKKPLSELHSLASAAGVEKFRMLSRGELVEKLSDGKGDGAGAGSGGSREPRGGEGRERPARRRRSRGSGGGSGERSGSGERPKRERPQREARPPREKRERAKPEPEEREAEKPAAPAPSASSSDSESEARPRRRRRRRRFGRRGKDELAIQDLLLPPEAGRQAILVGESREACTALLRGIAGELSGASKGPDPVVLLIDPSPEELADWKREAPQAEIVAAGQARHASDALAQAVVRAGGGEDVMLLIDSLTRLAAEFGDGDSAKELFDSGRVQGSAGGGSLTVVAALERSAE